MSRFSIVFASFVALQVAYSDVPVAMQRDFVTARNHISMRWNPAGYWTSPAGAFIGSGSSKEVCAAFTQTEQARGKIPSGFSFVVNSAGQYIATDRPLSRLPSAPSSPPPPVASSPVPATPSPQVPVLAPTSPKRVPLPPAIPPPTAVSMAPQIPIEPLRRNSGSTQVRRAAVVIDENAPPPVMARPSPEAAVAMREAVLDPVHPRPLSKPAVDAPASAPVPPLPASAAGADGIPADLQKSYLSRQDSVFMVFDREAKKWRSSEGAVPAASADEWCKTATEVDRRAQRIPPSYSYKHVGKGQVEVGKD